MRSAPSFALLAAGLVLAGCGGGSSSGSKALPGCAEAGAAVAGALPPSFPLPQGAVIDRKGHELGNRTAEGFVPGKLEDVRDYYERELGKRGYTLGEGDAEEHEAEADFSGHGVSGHFRLHDVAGCDGALTIAVAWRR
jgi:hypothetical protein